MAVALDVEEKKRALAGQNLAGQNDELDDTATGSVRKRRRISILQIGDSHTAADFFTGEVRRYLQVRYGNGSAGYLEVGRPHPGVLSTNLRVKASSGWTYSGIQQPSADVDRFALSGFRAHTAQSDETVAFAAQATLPYTDIDIEVEKGPGQGAIDILVDGRLVGHASLDAAEETLDVVHVQTRGGIAAMRQLVVKTTEAKPTTVLSVGIFNKRSGLSYSNVGFPGATVDILNKFPEATVTAALRRLAPDIVVLAFGTNEGFNDKLDLDQYRARYSKVIRTIRAGAPKAKIVMVGPSDANRVPAAHRGTPGCKKGPDAKPCKAPEDAAKSTTSVDASKARRFDARQAEEKLVDVKLPREVALSNGKCPYATPPQLDRVRSLQRDLAARQGIVFWDWSSLMPKRCGAQMWVAARPALMTADHVHFTKEGYKRGGRAFAVFIDPIVSRLVRDAHVVSNN